MWTSAEQPSAAHACGRTHQCPPHLAPGPFPQERQLLVLASCVWPARALHTVAARAISARLLLQPGVGSLLNARRLVSHAAQRPLPLAELLRAAPRSASVRPLHASWRCCSTQPAADAAPAASDLPLITGRRAPRSRPRSLTEPSPAQAPAPTRRRRSTSPTTPDPTSSPQPSPASAMAPKAAPKRKPSDDGDDGAGKAPTKKKPAAEPAWDAAAATSGGGGGGASSSNGASGAIKVNAKRVRQLKAGAPGAGPVLYWMSRDQRLDDNWALLYALEQAQARKRPVAIAFNLVSRLRPPRRTGAHRGALLSLRVLQARRGVRRALACLCGAGEPAWRGCGVGTDPAAESSTMCGWWATRRCLSSWAPARATGASCCAGSRSWPPRPRPSTSPSSCCRCEGTPSAGQRARATWQRVC